MRRLRWLLPVAILAILGSVGAVYLKQLALLDEQAPKRPPLLDPGVRGAANDWCYEQAQGEKSRVSVCASKMRSVDDRDETVELQGVKLKLFHDNATEFDLVTSDFALFNKGERKLFSEGNVEITLAVPAEGPPPGRLLKIHSSGVEFSSETGEASTSRPVSFEFDLGGGSAVGAHYNPAIRELRMDNKVVLDWRGKDGAQPMHVEAGEAWYFEMESRVFFPKWAKLTRGTLRMDTGAAEVLLEDGEIRQANMQAARGTHGSSGRLLEFAGEDVRMAFDDRMTVKSILAQRDARLISTAATARTTVTSDRLDMSFVAREHESVLTGAVASGNSVVRADPIARAGAPVPETRKLASNVIWMAMRPGGEEIERVETDGPGTLEFLPNRPDQVQRRLDGDRIWISYGAGNRIDRFRSINAKTRTELKPPRLTESKEILAFFDANSTLTRLEQNTDFRYEQGDRRASARKASFDQPTEMLTLEGTASTLDPSGRVNAERIMLDQKTGNYTAEGNVSTMRQPSRKAGSAGMLSSEEAMQATAKRMTSTDNNQRIRYEGDAKAWQGANRVMADSLDIDQQRHIMEAHGRVETQLVDKATKPGAAPFTTVRAKDLVYSTETKIAHYTGGVHLDRPGLTVDSQVLRAHLKEGEGSSLEKAYADQAVKIVSTMTVAGKGKRIRTGTSEHAEYYADEQRVFLKGGQPALVDSETGRITGCELTWWANNDRLQVVGGPECAGVDTVIPKK